MKPTRRRSPEAKRAAQVEENRILNNAYKSSEFMFLLLLWKTYGKEFVIFAPLKEEHDQLCQDLGAVIKNMSSCVQHENDITRPPLARMQLFHDFEDCVNRIDAIRAKVNIIIFETPKEKS